FDNATLNANVTNKGTVQVIGSPATFNGNFVNSGTFVSDPTTVHFATFQNDASGVVKAAPGDVYQVTGDFLNFSTQNTAWNTKGAILEFMGGTTHELRVNGADLGAGPAGFDNNFAWGGLKIDSGDTLTLAGLDDAVFYASAIIGADIVGNTVDNITGAFDIYYNAADAANAYLGGLTYDLEGGGKLIAAAAPEPATLFLAAPALAVFLRRRRKSLKA
ncbi:MAG TPA: PEP-CTERM sorting domain-containing protein, partial [Rhizomicrobium sp.]